MIKTFWIFELFFKILFFHFFLFIGIDSWLVTHWRIIGRLMGSSNQFLGQHYLYQVLLDDFVRWKKGIKTPSFPCWKEILLKKYSYLCSYKLNKGFNVLLLHTMNFLPMQLNFPKINLSWFPYIIFFPWLEYILQL